MNRRVVNFLYRHCSYSGLLKKVELKNDNGKTVNIFIVVQATSAEDPFHEQARSIS